MAQTEWKATKDHALRWIAFIGPRRLVVGALTTCIGVAVAWLLVRPSGAPIEDILPMAANQVVVAAPSTSVRPTIIKVHVAGAVRRPGVYVLASTARVVDAVSAAGGATARADLDSINLAQTIIDTEQVYIPVRSVSHTRTTVEARLKPIRQGSQPIGGSTPTTVIQSTSPGTSGSVSSRVNVNTATASQLDALPGVGPSTAKAIISYRTKHGLFARVEDLLNVPGIGPSKLAAMRDRVTI